MATGLSPVDRIALADAMKVTARAEIMAAAKSIDGQVRKVVQDTMEATLGKHIAELFQKCNELDIHVHALVDLLAGTSVLDPKEAVVTGEDGVTWELDHAGLLAKLTTKKLIEKKGVREAANRVVGAIIARQEAAKAAAKAGATAPASAAQPALAAPAPAAVPAAMADKAEALPVA